MTDDIEPRPDLPPFNDGEVWSYLTVLRDPKVDIFVSRRGKKMYVRQKPELFDQDA